MTTLGPSTDYTGAAVTQGGKKTFIAAMRALIADRLGVGYNLAPENVASASNVDLSAINTRQINLTGTTQVDTVTAPVGLSVVAKATAAVTLKAAVTGTGADIAMAAGDAWTWRATAADTMEVIGVVRKAAASDTAAGFVELATTAEALTGTDTVRAVTPAGLATTRRLAQVVSTSTGAVATGTTLIPVDDTIPQNTEGDQYMTQSITPTNSASELEVTVVFCASNSANSYIACALFRDSTANAVAVSTSIGGASAIIAQTFVYRVTAGSTSATTFKVRGGSSFGGSTITFNGVSGARLFGGVSASSITIKEYLP